MTSTAEINAARQRVTGEEIVGVEIIRAVTTMEMMTAENEPFRDTKSRGATSRVDFQPVGILMQTKEEIASTSKPMSLMCFTTTFTRSALK